MSTAQTLSQPPVSGLREGPVQIVVPIYNEGKNVETLYQSLITERVPFDSLRFIYDIDTDTSLPYIAQIAVRDERVRADKNLFGKGVVNALRWGFAHAAAGPVIVVMGDNSDKLSIVPEMVELWRRGAAVVCPSRYMRGGKQHGGGLLKSTLSRCAGMSLKLFGFPTADPTNNFKLYDGSWLSRQDVESVGGFEIALELCYKAFSQGEKIVELPTEWRDRTEGESRFRLAKWLPHYLKWYTKSLRCLVFGPSRST